jgi:hypothetical protein
VFQIKLSIEVSFTKQVFIDDQFLNVNGTDRVANVHNSLEN